MGNSMTTISNVLEVNSRDEFRQWLALNHQAERECWVAVKRGKPIDGGKTFWYVDAVEEAVCFGWIDSTTKKLDDGVTYQRFAPRRAGSAWSELNKARCRRLERLGRMTDAGRAIMPTDELVIMPEILEALQADPVVWDNFQRLPDLYRKVRIDTIGIKRRQWNLFNQRLKKFVENTRQGILYGEWSDNGRLLTILETDRLLLRELTLDDVPCMRTLLQDPLVMYAYEGPFTEDMVMQWYDRQQERYRLNGFGLWSVIEKSSGAWVGMCGLTIQPLNGAEVIEVGYLLSHSHWHKGFATEAARGCMDYARNQLGLKEVYSMIRDSNEASVKVAIRNGMKQEGIVIKHYRGVEMPHAVYKANLT